VRDGATDHAAEPWSDMRGMDAVKENGANA
jgi:hypothetical protein